MWMKIFILKDLHEVYIKRKLRSKKSLAQMKEHEKCKKWAITDLNVPNGSRDIPFQSQEFEPTSFPGVC